MSAGREISKHEKEKQKYIQEKCQALLNEMLRDDDNKYCVDCDAKGPRWASWNLGIFLCIRCAGIHRNLGVHISRVKSVNLDTWTPEQVETMQQMGNSRARAVYEANRPDSMRRPQTDVALESFIRAKYETHKYIAQEWVKPPPPKVNWDAEVEESLKKKKDKKQIQNDIGPLPTAIPKPKPNSSSPVTVSKLSTPPKQDATTKRVPAPTDNATPVQSKPNASEDLLGLITGPPAISASDPFASPVKVSAAPDVITSQGQEDLGSIFTSDIGFDPNQSQKMTKESILSLYGQAPSNANPFSSQGVYPNTGANNPFPQMAAPYNSNLIGQGQNSFGNIQSDLGILNGTPSGTNNTFNPQQDVSQIQQQLYGLNLSTFNQPQGMPSTMPNFGQHVGGFVGNNQQQSFPAHNNPMAFKPLNIPNASIPGQPSFGTYQQPPNPTNLMGLNNISVTNNANQIMFPKDGPIAANNFFK